MFSYDPKERIGSIALVGVWGTGSQVARTLARTLYSMKEARLETPDLVLVDGDTVEMKNVGRQMFTPADVGQNKATLLAGRFNRALGLSIEALPTFFHRDFPLHLSGYRHNKVLIVGCVDNAEARREIATYVRRESCIWLDGGNHFEVGQVILGDAGQDDRLYSTLSQNQKVLNHLPFPDVVMPDLLEDDPPTEDAPASCAELVAMGEQHLLINEYVALAMGSLVFSLLYRQPIHHHMVHVSAQGIMRPEFLTDELVTFWHQPQMEGTPNGFE
jgi:PRTRC genetic system ThiF family protein